MKRRLTCLLAITIYLTNGDSVRIEQNWLVDYRIFIGGASYVQYTIENEIHRIPMFNVIEIVETPYNAQ